MNKLNSTFFCYANKLTEFPKSFYYINNISYKIRVRYFKPLVYKEKALARKRRGFLFLTRAEPAHARDKNKKTRADAAGGCRAFLWAVTPRGTRGT